MVCLRCPVASWRNVARADSIRLDGSVDGDSGLGWEVMGSVGPYRLSICLQWQDEMIWLCQVTNTFMRRLADFLRSIATNEKVTTRSGCLSDSTACERIDGGARQCLTWALGVEAMGDICSTVCLNRLLYSDQCRGCVHISLLLVTLHYADLYF